MDWHEEVRRRRVERWDRRARRMEWERRAPMRRLRRLGEFVIAAGMFYGLFLAGSLWVAM